MLIFFSGYGRIRHIRLHQRCHDLQDLLVEIIDLSTVGIEKRSFHIPFSLICLFVCSGIIIPLEICSLIWRRHTYRWRTAHFDLCSAVRVIEQWGFFTVPHLLWHGASVLKWSSPQTFGTHTYCRAFSSVAVTTSYYMYDLR